MKLINRTEITKPDIVYNLEVKNNHNYLANDVVVSNCHGTKAAQLQSLLIDHGANIAHRYGLTGTLPKDPCSKMLVHVALGEVKCEYHAKDLIAKGWLATLDISILQLDDVSYLENNGIPRANLMMYEEEEHFVKTNASRMEWIANTIIENKAQSKLGNTLVLVNTIKYGKELHKLIPNSYVLNGSNSDKSRKAVYDLFETNDDVVAICTKQIAGVGLSIDRIFNLVYVDAGKSFITTIQQIGRGLRKGRDKDSVNILDICSNLPSASKRLRERIKHYKDASYPYKKYLIGYENDS